jgi:hypothetical protein
MLTNSTLQGNENNFADEILQKTSHYQPIHCNASDINEMSGLCCATCKTV